ncbi:FAD-dependent oxidoreductase [Maricaulis sp.]|uniref:NAD(P)/FAD-dependent oxidoreductase n=1 Tax=Maricaulis sp. TaxID=1486257 RepID=UPI002628A4A2|nr:FAD-dependent oxidoreductase [Maricaulis sp.]
MRLAIIGAGLSGLACGDRLKRAGHAVELFEKSRGTGGRLATRRREIASFDHGTQYVTARSPEFSAYLERAFEAGNADRWSPAGADKGKWIWWVGQPGMSGLVKPLAKQLLVHTSIRVEAIERESGGWRLEAGDNTPETRFDAVLVTAPVPQTTDLLARHGAAFASLPEAELAPCWTVMLAFDAPLPVAADVFRHDAHALAWCARNSSKPGRPGEADAWVLQASPAWSVAHLEAEPDWVIAQLTAMFVEIAGQALPVAAHGEAHRWRYARVTEPLGQPFVWEAGLGLGAAGDWCMGPRVEAAFQSGVALADAVLAEPER